MSNNNKNNKIIEAWDKMKPGDEIKEQIFEDIMQKRLQRKKSPRFRFGKTTKIIAAAAAMILCVFGFQALPFNSDTNTGNRFSIAAHANDGTMRITKNMRVILPKGAWEITERGTSYDGLYFKIEGQNIKSVAFESKDSSFVDLMAIFRAPDTEAKNAILSLAIPGVPLTIDEYIPEAQVHWDPVKFLILKMLDLRQSEEDAETIKFYRERWDLDDYSFGDYMRFAKDIITITVTFADGEIMTQIIEMEINDETGELSARIIS